MKSIEQLQSRINQLEAHNEKLSCALAQLLSAHDEISCGLREAVGELLAASEVAR
jgi:hypothetical protein